MITQQEIVRFEYFSFWYLLTDSSLPLNLEVDFT